MQNSKSPAAFFDTFDEMPNPFKKRVTTLSHLVVDAPEDALKDYQYASEFIYSYRGSPDTFSTYRREIEHFLHWCWLIIININITNINFILFFLSQILVALVFLDRLLASWTIDLFAFGPLLNNVILKDL